MSDIRNMQHWFERPSGGSIATIRWAPFILLHSRRKGPLELSSYTPTFITTSNSYNSYSCTSTQLNSTQASKSIMMKLKSNWTDYTHFRVGWRFSLRLQRSQLLVVFSVLRCLARKRWRIKKTRMSRTWKIPRSRILLPSQLR
jgi:hypothetical protein